MITCGPPQIEHAGIVFYVRIFYVMIFYVMFFYVMIFYVIIFYTFNILYKNIKKKSKKIIKKISSPPNQPDPHTCATMGGIHGWGGFESRPCASTTTTSSADRVTPRFRAQRMQRWMWLSYSRKAVIRSAPATITAHCCSSASSAGSWGVRVRGGRVPLYGPYITHQRGGAGGKAGGNTEVRTKAA